MLLAHPHRYAVVTATPLESHPDIGLDLLEHMAKVQRSIGIGESGGHEILRDVIGGEALGESGVL